MTVSLSVLLPVCRHVCPSCFASFSGSSFGGLVLPSRNGRKFSSGSLSSSLLLGKLKRTKGKSILTRSEFQKFCQGARWESVWHVVEEGQEK